MDLLQHEGVVAALLGGVGVPVDLADLALQKLAADRHELDAVRTQHHDLIVVHVLNLVGLGEEGRHGAADELLAVSAAHHQRAFLARSDQHTGFVGTHRDERVVTVELTVGEANSLGQVAVIVFGDQVRDHLCVGLRGEHRAVREQALAQDDVVLDDAVDGDVDAAVGAVVRVGVGFGDTPMCGPARVGDAGARLGFAVRLGLGLGLEAADTPGVAGPCARADERGVTLVNRRLQPAEVADRTDQIDAVSVQHRDPGAVVAAVLEFLESVEQQRPYAPRPDVADDSAH